MKCYDTSNLLIRISQFCANCKENYFARTNFRKSNTQKSNIFTQPLVRAVVLRARISQGQKQQNYGTYEGLDMLFSKSSKYAILLGIQPLL